MTHLEVDLSASAFVAFNRTLRGIGVDALSAADPGSMADRGQTARPGESVLASFHTPILRRLLERAIEAMDEDSPHQEQLAELRRLLETLQAHREIGICVLLTPGKAS